MLFTFLTAHYVTKPDETIFSQDCPIQPFAGLNGSPTSTKVQYTHEIYINIQIEK